MVWLSEKSFRASFLRILLRKMGAEEILRNDGLQKSNLPAASRFVSVDGEKGTLRIRSFHETFSSQRTLSRLEGFLLMPKPHLTTSPTTDQRDFRICFKFKGETFCKALPVLTHLPTAA
jgi:hypothetical protein